MDRETAEGLLDKRYLGLDLLDDNIPRAVNGCFLSLNQDPNIPVPVTSITTLSAMPF